MINQDIFSQIFEARDSIEILFLDECCLGVLGDSISHMPAHTADRNRTVRIGEGI